MLLQSVPVKTRLYRLTDLSGGMQYYNYEFVTASSPNTREWQSWGLHSEKRLTNIL